MTKQNKPWQDIADAAGILRAHKQMELADRLQKHAEALAQPEQESVARSDAYDMIDRFLRNNLHDDDYAEYSSALDSLYTAPPQRKPLTDEQIAHATAPVFMGGNPSLTGITRAIEAAHNIGVEK